MWLKIIIITIIIITIIIITIIIITIITIIIIIVIIMYHSFFAEIFQSWQKGKTSQMDSGKLKKKLHEIGFRCYDRIGQQSFWNLFLH